MLKPVSEFVAEMGVVAICCSFCSARYCDIIGDIIDDVIGEGDTNCSGSEGRKGVARVTVIGRSLGRDLLLWDSSGEREALRRDVGGSRTAVGGSRVAVGTLALPDATVCVI